MDRLQWRRKGRVAMSIYRELNGVPIDLGEYAEEELTRAQRKQWEKRMASKLKAQKPARRMKYAGAAAVVMVAIGITISSSHMAFANVPIIGNVIERSLALFGHKAGDLTPYKTSIGTAMKDKYGTFTLDEAIIDDGQLLLSATYVAAKARPSFYQVPQLAEVWMNGKEISLLGLAMYTVTLHDPVTILYEVPIDASQMTEPVSFRAAFSFEKDDTTNAPWAVDINVSTKRLVQDSLTVSIDRIVHNSNGESIHFAKLVATPVSTVLYFDGTEGAVGSFLLVSESGAIINPFDERRSSAEGSVYRYPAINWRTEKYEIVPTDGAYSPRIRINP
ncbi:DUF4179 domain-containing protein [Paenibacillus sp. MMS18-CY102]|uniref:DUF4179 domain-containing protein n=1 Tax=Paenibacillus sp. MMS18-CY102 TaxID=2682849 RepID=UPI00136604EB|nr:DUF4179 domain-containing protein [Paenibacillus sp. MMS18-CY102]MWC30958.1 DUF4179 domain-containing protein [Paenibacillus sp. MMS18-CY102]